MNGCRLSKKSTSKSEHLRDLLRTSFCVIKPFRNNYMLCKITDRYINVIFVEIQLKKENSKSVFRRPNRYTDLPNGLDTSLQPSHPICSQILKSMLFKITSFCKDFIINECYVCWFFPAVIYEFIKLSLRLSFPTPSLHRIT